MLHDFAVDQDAGRCLTTGNPWSNQLYSVEASIEISGE
jgi:hypothetical protein